MKDGFLDKLITRLDRFSPSEVQNLVSRLVREKGFLENVFESLREGIFILSTEGVITYANDSACQFFGIDHSKLQGSHIQHAIRGLKWENIANPESTTVRDLQVFYPEQLTLNLYTSPIIGNIEGKDEHIGFVILIRDITQSTLETEEKIESEKLNILTMLAAGVAHEIGNPLNSLDIHLQLLRRKLAKSAAADDETLQQLLDTAQQEIKRLDGILKQFLNAVRPTTPVREPSQLHQILERTLESLAAELSDRKAKVTLDLADKLPLLNLDANQIQQAFYNLIRNAAQALPASGGDITIRSHASDSEVVLSICDNGSGISPEHMGSMYEPYKTTKSSGTGLGLLVVRRIIREHGGDLEIQSELGVGTTVSIHLPSRDRTPLLLTDHDDTPIIDLDHSH
ncbi:two-component system sensor histidine kinase NtrB [Rubritalea marina]|uniref:two-component system sensor histidine kinase NtrB n=1 Tax=Rubritalea marina TaxID=361055 RepID=UPI000381B778|nr:ATP-binding protein [Rubritalea marina]